MGLTKPPALVFASGEKDGGGSGLRCLIKSMEAGDFNARIVGAVSNHEFGGVKKIIDEDKDRNGIPFIHMGSDFTEEHYRTIAKQTGAEWFLLSGWLKFVRGLPAERTINIHPGCSAMFGGKGMYGHFVHEAVMKAYVEGIVHCSHVTMFFADDIAYDNGKVFYKQRVPIVPNDTPETLAKRVNWFEHKDEPMMFSLVVNRQIRLLEDGRVAVPLWYKQLECCPDHCIVDVAA